MNNSINVTKIVTWEPFVYPVRWAEKSSDVPEWDVSRGNHPSEYLDHLTAQNLGLDIEALSDAILEDFPWETVEAAPRVSRKNPLLVAERPILMAFTVPKVRCVERLAQLALHLDNDEKMKKRISGFASIYGPLNTHSSPNSLISWKEHSKRARFFLKLAQAVNTEVRKAEHEQHKVADILDEIRLPEYMRKHTGYRASGSDVALILTLMRFGVEEVVEDFFRTSDLKRFAQASRFLQPMDSVAAIQAELHHFFQTKFESAVHLTLKGSKLVYRHGCIVQMYRELAEAFSSDSAELKVCKACGNVFFARNAKQQYCDPPEQSKCRKRAYDMRANAMGNTA